MRRLSTPHAGSPIRLRLHRVALGPARHGSPVHHNHMPILAACNGPALGARAGEARLGGMIRNAGFKNVRRATETPFDIVLAARK